MRRRRVVGAALVMAVMIFLMFSFWLPQSLEPVVLGMPLHYSYMVLYGLLCVGSTALIFGLVWPRGEAGADGARSDGEAR